MTAAFLSPPPSPREAAAAAANPLPPPAAPHPPSKTNEPKTRPLQALIMFAALFIGPKYQSKMTLRHRTTTARDQNPNTSPEVGDYFGKYLNALPKAVRWSRTSNEARKCAVGSIQAAVECPREMVEREGLEPSTPAL